MFLLDISDAELADMLAEDVGRGDLTTHLLGIGQEPGVMTFTARDPMTIACCEEAERILIQAGCAVKRSAASGDALATGSPILVARGSAGAIHRGWKVAQTLVEIASGIATGARKIVDASRSVREGVPVVCTRKNVPGTKAMSVKAITAGGASPHRLGLSETILVFDAHRAFCGNSDVAQIVGRLKTRAPEKKIMVEIASIDEALVWARAGVDVIQADKMTPFDIGSLVERLGAADNRPIISAAGGVNEKNAADYVRAGADVLVTSAPYTAKPLDVQVRIAAAR